MPRLNNILYLVGTILDKKANAMCCSSVTQLTFSPPLIAASINKNTLTHDFVKERGTFSICLLGRNQSEMAHYFGRNSGRQIDKFESYTYRLSNQGNPFVEGCPGYFDCKVDHQATVELETHTVFVGEILDAEVGSMEAPLTYLDYQQEMCVVH
ncbi:flavin reductase family protein [Desulforamulus aquiferis]|uniref:Flavin reductase family protein n=1 Tax=Desulforamulus aquiferis TaxID=1397668 RepID=A0AAW7ZHB2_9FIRM|nr:flavin reductase family protein [Desulforamulus aquiferis]MDO7789068.1 flavin reductase family protein [Desulforamulus aquiferis]